MANSGENTQKLEPNAAQFDMGLWQPGFHMENQLYKGFMSISNGKDHGCSDIGWAQMEADVLTLAVVF